MSLPIFNPADSPFWKEIVAEEISGGFNDQFRGLFPAGICAGDLGKGILATESPRHRKSLGFRAGVCLA
jgi:hypothetical protein